MSKPIIQTIVFQMDLQVLYLYLYLYNTKINQINVDPKKIQDIKISSELFYKLIEEDFCTAEILNTY